MTIISNKKKIKSHSKNEYNYLLFVDINTFLQTIKTNYKIENMYTNQRNDYVCYCTLTAPAPAPPPSHNK